ncbi:hypothetical protein BTA51_17855 [Hahella sp. CCB-MM4]|uniref:phosphodiester glycosidase family protein n=1 Tax=Hahella sp. (strain CCB-MM4) TaxID=1926491 RepID=UPI000B9B5ABA|nr:phosphodiester glycosidase family protein [Hahella sp. CCB-MM4]OZG71873.1 hypothetical protein BTA51_17855 [Hahella sp. CCB-MM4]
MATPMELELGIRGFWSQVAHHTKGKSYAFLKDGPLFYLVFDDSVKMEPFVRTSEIMFDARAMEATRTNGYLATINAQVYGINTTGKIDYAVGSDPVTPKGIEPEGYTVLGKTVIAGRAAPLNFFIANTQSKSPKYQFGFGSAPVNVDAAIGGAGPIIVNGLPYGVVNKYRKGTTPGKPVGKPSPEKAKNLIQRSNATFTAFTKHASSPRTGITAIAHHSKEKKLAVLVLPDNSGDLPLTSLQAKLLNVGFDNAIFLDGSNSSMLMVEGAFYARQGESKNMTNVVGIGFKY